MRDITSSSTFFLQSNQKKCTYCTLYNKIFQPCYSHPFLIASSYCGDSLNIFTHFLFNIFCADVKNNTLSLSFSNTLKIRQKQKKRLIK